MLYGTIPGVEKPVSRLIAGLLDQHSDLEAESLLDTFFARGGTALDTAWTYDFGRQERFLGRWLERRGGRDEVVIVTKGAHTPYCNPYDLSRQLVQSLDRLRTDYVDLYLVHRDNEDIPVADFVDVLNDHLSAGRIRSFGVSNWTIGRIEAANAYATANGLRGIAALSNHFSLARMVQPTYPGSLSAWDSGSRMWLEQTQLPLLAWSSQARGFFAEPDPGLVERMRVGRVVRVARRRFARRLVPAWADGWDRDEYVRCWYSRDNFRRLNRARSLAAERGAHTAAIALAYVLSQPFPTFAIIGSRTNAELSSSFAALDIELTPDETVWLDSRT